MGRLGAYCLSLFFNKLPHHAVRLHSFCRSLKHEKDQLQQRLDAQQQTSSAPPGLSAESEQQMQGLAEQLSQTETQLQVGGTSDTEGNTQFAAAC